MQATPPSRADLSAPEVRLLHQGGPTKADLFLVSHAGRQVVVKDFARKRAWVRLWGRLQVGHEVAVYRALDGLEGVPAYLGRVDAHALAIEYLQGKNLHQCRRRPQRTEYFAHLAGIMKAMHARGVIHNDLRGKDNVLVLHDDHRVVLVDFAGALRLRPGGLPHRLLFRWLAKVDRAALLKWKTHLVPEDVSDEEQVWLERFLRWRRLWLFNLKGHGPGGREGR